MADRLRLAIDLDNTIISYDALFVQAARERRLVNDDFTGTKLMVRDAICRRAGGQASWQLLQADVYGENIARAVPFDGVREFMARARDVNAYVAIVSHKTQFAGSRQFGTNLRDVAFRWLLDHGFVGNGAIAEADVFFESSRKAKLDRLRTLQAHIVIDDLIEIFSDSAFPEDSRRWWFVPGQTSGLRGQIECFVSWHEMRYALET